jgi:hypothetical protein
VTVTSPPGEVRRVASGAGEFEELTMNLVMGLILAGSGLFSVFGGVSGSEWFMSFRNSRWVVDMLGRTGARVLYVLVGLACIAFSAFFFTAWFLWDAPARPN